LECAGTRDISFIQVEVPNPARSDGRPATLSTKRRTEDSHDGYGRIFPTLSASLGGSELGIYICYSRNKVLRPGGLLNLVLEETQLHDTITAGTSTATGQLFHQTFLSFATLVFGTQHRQTNIIVKGLEMRGMVLKQLNQALSDPKCHTRDDIILSVVALSMLESLVPTGPRCYLQHRIGLESLLKLRDPGTNYSSKTPQIYKSLRVMILFASVRMGRPSIFAKEEWKRVLRTDCSEKDLEEQYLFDVLADCTVLVAERDDMLSRRRLSRERSSHQQDTLKKRTLTSLQYLQAWRIRWSTVERNIYFESPAPFAKVQATRESLGDDPPFLITAFEFSNDESALMLILYNAVLIYVLQLLASLSLSGTGVHSNPNQCFTVDSLQIAGRDGSLWDLTKDDYTAAERLAALEICRCLPYYLDRISHLDGGSSPVFQWGVTTAWMTLRRGEAAENTMILDLLSMQSRGAIAQALWIG
jgi:hypothetical protein